MHAQMSPLTRSSAGGLSVSSRAARDYMRELPFDLHSALGRQDTNVVHGWSRRVNEYLLEDQSASRYEGGANAEAAQILLFDHAHEPWSREHGRPGHRLPLGRQAQGRGSVRRRVRRTLVAVG